MIPTTRSYHPPADTLLIGPITYHPPSRQHNPEPGGAFLRLHLGVQRRVLRFERLHQHQHQQRCQRIDDLGLVKP